MTRLVVGLAGKRGSGKTTIASTLRTQFGFTPVSFGDFVRAAAATRGLTGDVETLAGVGSALIDELGWDGFCEAVMKGAGAADRVVVDGIRHRAAHLTIRRQVEPGRFRLVFVDIDEELRVRRLVARGGDNDALATEASNELDQLRDDAGLIVDGGQSDAAAQIMRWSDSVCAGRA